LSDRIPAAEVLTIMMTDVVGSTELLRARGDRGADDILALQGAIVHRQVTAFGGRVHKSLGDGFLMSFPSTVAAVRAAAAIQRALSEHNTADPQRSIEIRIGIHTGEVTERDGDLLGQAVHAAARVMAEAGGGQILTTDDVRKFAQPQLNLSFFDSGLFWLRGFPESWRCTRCPGTTPRRACGPVQCRRRSRRSLSGTPSGQVCAGCSMTRGLGTGGSA
jgi:class 3 adenylate cyclase